MICDKKDCTGCFACYNICKFDAIKMTEDEHGCIYPKIDEKKCVNCNLCRKVCPAINNNVQFSAPQKAFAAYVKDSEKLKKSTSGGIATVLAESIIEREGIVYGATFKKGCYVEHIRITKLEDLDKIKGSKYVHSYINEVYKSVREDLLNKKKVLFTGTPCQVAGLRGFLRKDFENLYCVDIICHGVPSQKYLKDELAEYKDKIDNISFRGQDGYVLKAYSEGQKVLDKKLEDSCYYEGFLSSLILRENCYECKYAKKERCSDITLGDFWGLSKDSRFYSNRKNGISVVLPNTEKGLEIFDHIKEKIEFEERSVEEAVKGNTQLNKPSKKPISYKKFHNYYEKYGFYNSYKKSTRIKSLKKKIKKSKFIYSIYKRIKRRA